MQKIPVTKQISDLIKVAGVPAGLIALVGDFFSAQGGWLVVALIGLVALLVALFFYFTLTGEPDCVQKKKWYSLVSDDPEFLRYFVGGHSLTIPAVNMPAAFGAACLFMANMSFADAKDGGFVAKNVDMVKAAQLQVGLMEQQLDVSRGIQSAVLDVKRNTEGLKKETSADPRKEVANFGFSWSQSDFYKSLRQDDPNLVGLYLSGGMPIDRHALDEVVTHGSDSLQALVASQGKVKNQAVCDDGLDSVNFEWESKANALLGVLGALCKNDQTRDYARRRLKEAEDAYSTEVAALRAEFPSEEKCFQAEWRGDGRQLREEALDANGAAALKGRVSARTILLLEVKSLLIAQQPAGAMMSEVKKYCQRQVARAASVDDREAKKWARIAKAFS